MKQKDNPRIIKKLQKALNKSNYEVSDEIIKGVGKKAIQNSVNLMNRKY